jgi:hypothetical protein
MTIRRLQRSEWGEFCRHASHGHFAGKHASIEIFSLEFGAQLEAQHQPWIGMAYDPQRDFLELIAGDLDHLVNRPRELYVDETLPDLISMEIVDEDGVRQIVTLRDPVMLPPPTTSGW